MLKGDRLKEKGDKAFLGQIVTGNCDKMIPRTIDCKDNPALILL